MTFNFYLKSIQVSSWKKKSLKTACVPDVKPECTLHLKWWSPPRRHPFHFYFFPVSFYFFEAIHHYDLFWIWFSRSPHSVLKECCNINRDDCKVFREEGSYQDFRAELVLNPKSSLFSATPSFTSGISANWFELILIAPNSFNWFSFEEFHMNLLGLIYRHFGVPWLNIVEVLDGFCEKPARRGKSVNKKKNKRKKNNISSESLLDVKQGKEQQLE